MRLPGRELTPVGWSEALVVQWRVSSYGTAMGCNPSKVEDEPDKTQRNGNAKGGDDLGQGGGGEQQPVKDNRAPLNQRQTFSLKASWKAIHRNMEDVGIEMFLRSVHFDHS